MFHEMKIYARNTHAWYTYIRKNIEIVIAKLE